MDGLATIMASSAATAAADRTTLVLGTAMRQAREQAAALVQLIQSPPAPSADGVGRHVSYRA